jgi:hypothetical protein
MPNDVNPYIAGNPLGLKDKRAFFGRKDILAWVNNELRNAGTNALVLFGQRRIGKTSLLLQLEHNLPSDDFLTVYFDLQDTSTLPLGRLLGDLADTVLERAGLELPDDLNFDNDGRSFRRKFLPEFLEKIGENRRPVILLDEFDVLDQTAEAELPAEAASKSLLPFLRRLMREEPRMAFVFVSGRHPGDLRMDFSATLKGSLQRDLWILDQPSAIQLIRLGETNGTLHYTEAAIERILLLTNGHPYLTQLLCQRLWECAHTPPPVDTPDIDVADIEAAIPLAIEAGENALEWLWKGLQPAERIYAAALAEIAVEANQPITEDQVVAVLSTYAARLRTREVELAPQDLVKRRVIELSSDRTYRFAVELFRLWVKEKQPLLRVKDELDRVDVFAEQLFNVAYGFFRQREWQRALESFQDVLQRNPRHFKAQLYLGETLLELESLPEAIEAFQKAQALDREEARLPLARAWLQAARQQARLGNDEAALRACTETLILSPNEKDARDIQFTIWTKRGDAALEQNDWAKALEAFEHAGNGQKLEMVREAQRKEWETKGDLALQNRDWEAARAAFEQAKRPDLVERVIQAEQSDWIRIGDESCQQKEWQVALDAYQKAGRSDSIEKVREAQRQEWIEQGNRALRDHLWDNARSAYQQAEALDLLEKVDEMEKADWIRQGDEAVRFQNWQAALQAYANAKRSDLIEEARTAQQRVLILQGNQALKDKDLKSALTAFEQAGADDRVAQVRDQIQLEENYDNGVKAYQQEDWSRAAGLLQKVVEKNLVYERNGQMAIKLLTLALEYIENPPSHFRLWLRRPVATPLVLITGCLIILIMAMIIGLSSSAIVLGVNGLGPFPWIGTFFRTPTPINETINALTITPPYAASATITPTVTFTSTATRTETPILSPTRTKKHPTRSPTATNTNEPSTEPPSPPTSASTPEPTIIIQP